MRKYFLMIVFLLAGMADHLIAQSTAANVVNSYAVEKTLAVNTVDTIYFALPPEFGWVGFNKTDTTTGFNSTTKLLAPTFKWNGNAKLSIDLIIGNVADSMRIAIFSVTQYSVTVKSGTSTTTTVNVFGDVNSLVYLAGTASTFSTVVGNGNSNAFTVTENIDPSPAIGIVITLGDLVGGSRRLRLALTLL